MLGRGADLLRRRRFQNGFLRTLQVCIAARREASKATEGRRHHFPLERHYDSVRLTYEGVSGSLPSGEVDSDLPGHDEDDPYRSGEDPTDPRDQGGVDPTAPEEDKITRAEPFDYGTDSMGRTCPRDKYGYRITPRSRRPEGVPPNIWMNLAELTKAATPADLDVVASSSMMAIQPVHIFEL